MFTGPQIKHQIGKYMNLSVTLGFSSQLLLKSKANIKNESSEGLSSGRVQRSSFLRSHNKQDWSLMTWGPFLQVLRAPEGSEVDWEEPKLQVWEKNVIGVLTLLISSGERAAGFLSREWYAWTCSSDNHPAAVQTTDHSVATGHGLVKRLLKFSRSATTAWTRFSSNLVSLKSL